MRRVGLDIHAQQQDKHGNMEYPEPPNMGRIRNTFSTVPTKSKVTCSCERGRGGFEMKAKGLEKCECGQVFSDSKMVMIANKANEKRRHNRFDLCQRGKKSDILRQEGEQVESLDSPLNPARIPLDFQSVYPLEEVGISRGELQAELGELLESVIKNNEDDVATSTYMEPPVASLDMENEQQSTPLDLELQDLLTSLSQNAGQTLPRSPLLHFDIVEDIPNPIIEKENVNQMKDLTAKIVAIGTEFEEIQGQLEQARLSKKQMDLRITMLNDRVRRMTKDIREFQWYMKAKSSTRGAAILKSEYSSSSSTLNSGYSNDAREESSASSWEPVSGSDTAIVARNATFSKPPTIQKSLPQLSLPVSNSKSSEAPEFMRDAVLESSTPNSHTKSHQGAELRQKSSIPFLKSSIRQKVKCRARGRLVIGIEERADGVRSEASKEREGPVLWEQRTRPSNLGAVVLRKMGVGAHESDVHTLSVCRESQKDDRQ